MTVPPHIETFWQSFVASDRRWADASEQFYESFRIGDTDEVAREGARLILSGEKTATSSPLWEYETSGKALPYVGALSVLEDDRHAVCVVRTTWLDILPFGEVGADFARAYAESDGTLAGWRAMMRDHYSPDRAGGGRHLALDTPLVCERLELVYTGRAGQPDGESV
ncbi:MAG: ASCH domain-containing protein [Pseudomonadota bacterium]